MPRQRTSTEPPKERAKLRTTEEINLEIRKLYRRFANKQLSATELKSRVAALTALRSGMAAPIEQPDPGADFRPGIEHFSIVGIPRDWCVVGLFGRDAHMPSETVQRLREMLPGAIGSPPSLDNSLPPPIDDAPRTSAPPFLRLHDGTEPEPPEAA